MQEGKLRSSDLAPGDRFGASLRLHGDDLAVSAPSDDDGAPDTGAAYLFRRGGSAWAEQGKLLDPIPSPSNGFGCALALEGDRVLVGSTGAEGGDGRVHSFHREGATWVYDQALANASPEPDTGFGASVSMHGEWAAVGAPYQNDGAKIDCGSVTVFRHDGERWNPVAWLLASDGETDDFYGWDLELGPDRLLVGAPGEDDSGSFSGAGYLHLLGDASWREDRKLTFAEEAAGHGCGYAASLAGSNALLGAPFDDHAGYHSGSVAVFDVRDCRSGSVNAGRDATTDVLHVNGSTGGRDRRVEVPEGRVILAFVLRPPAGGRGGFVIHANTGEPTGASLTPLPADIGLSCFPLLLPSGATPRAVWNGLGRPERLGASRYFDGAPLPDPRPAPSIFLLLPAGDPVHLPAGTVLSLQGVILDPGAASPLGASTTNLVVLEIL
jgi:hypothetical protein